jgi:PAS domain S-box-containing protein
MPHDNVLKYVLDGRSDVGFVRSGVLESAVRESKLDIKQIKILNLQEHQGFPQQISTRLYPEWPFSALSKTDENLARHVAAALFVMEENIPVMNAMRIHGFSIPADYTPVENVLRELRFPPFDATPAFTLPDVFERYRWQVVSAFLAIIAIILLSFRLLLTKRKLEEEKQIVLVQSGQLRASKTRLQTILDNEPECIKIINADGLLTHLNPAGLAMIEADSLAQVIGLPVLDIITPEYRTAYLELHKRVLAGEAMQMEFEVVGFKGGHRLLETHAVPMQDDGSVVHLAITRDITDRKNAEIEKEAALARVKKLEGIVPICMHCKKIRDDKNSWNQLERYISDHSEARFSHGICPECLEEQMTKYNESKKITHK